MVNQYPEVVTGIALGTLASKTVLKILSGYEGVVCQQKTLLKNIRLRGAIANMTSGEGPLLFGLAWGELNTTQIKAALETVYAPETGASGTPLSQQANLRRIAWETLFVVHRVSATAFNLDVFDSGKRGLGAGKGFPFMENAGWQIFVYNLSNAALTTAATISIQQEAWGVSLE